MLDRRLSPGRLRDIPQSEAPSHDAAASSIPAVRSGYRPDVDGLRAVAVSLVFVNHASHAALPSGYVGVDVFFVISGFVVTSSILSGSYGPGFRGLLEFWRRRILRIFPALLVFTLVAAVMLSAFFSLTTMQQFQGAMRTGIAALLGVSNLFLIRIASDYFLADQSINVFNHTWSLGVEEQFYFLFAPLIVLAPGLTRLGSRVLAPLLLVLGGMSLYLFMARAEAQPMVTYYGIHARFWELATGSLLAVWLQKGRLALHPAVASGLGVVGALAIGQAAMLPSPQGQFVLPVLLAVTGAATVIASGASQGAIVARLLANPALVFLGLLSYSLYLWHWPVLVFARWNVGISAATAPLIALVTLLLAWLSYRFVETPIRHMRAPLLTRVLPAFLLVLVAVAGALSTLAASQGALYAGARYEQADWLPAPEAPYAASGAITARDCLITDGSSLPAGIPDRCRTRAPAGSDVRKVLLVGDSHAFSQFAMLAELEREPGLMGLALVHDGCSWHLPKTQLGPSCAAYQAAVPGLIRANLSAGDVVLLGFYFPYDGAPTVDLETRLDSLQAAAAEKGARLVVEVPHLRSLTPAIHCTREWFRSSYDGCTRSIDDMRTARAGVVTALEQYVASRRDPPLLWDPLESLCRGGVCAAITDKGPVLRDTNHVSAWASRSLAPSFRAFLAANGTPGLRGR